MTQELYNKVAAHYNITVLELRKRICGGERLIHQYYMETNTHDF